MVLKSPKDDYSRGYRTLLDEIIKANRKQIVHRESAPVSKNLEKINEKNKYLFVLTKSDTVTDADKDAELKLFFPIIDKDDNAADFPEFWKDNKKLRWDVLSYYGGSFFEDIGGDIVWELEKDYKDYAKKLWRKLKDIL
ncbi:MAG: hypothetical protein IJ748_01125 [Bacteroidales bacterium]|nr:hypothetical protein [Bacteroidales bacterium]